MNLSFFTKIFDRSAQLSSSFGKKFSYVRGACKYKDKVYQGDIYRKNNTCTSCVLMTLSIDSNICDPVLFNVSYSFQK